MLFRRAFPLAVALALPLSLAACSSGSSDCTDPNTPGCVAVSDKERVTTPDVSDAEVSTAVKGNTAFAMDLYQQLRGEQGNVFYSPFSISEALAMTWAGARGQTEEQMAKALHFDLGQGKQHPAFNALDLALMSRGEGASGSDGGVFRINIANALWGQTGYAFETPFLDTLALNYGAGMRLVDYEKPEEARGLINDWVAEKTEDRIKDLIPEGSLDPSTRLVLTNAIYFNAAWATPFEASNTHDMGFTKRDGSTIQVPMMAGYQEAPYGEGEGYAALEIPYDGHQMSMVLVLPAEGTLDDFEASLTGDKLAAITSGMTDHGVSVMLPRFKIESQFDLGDKLSKLGMVDAFTGAADFSGMNGKGGLYISAVIHKAFVDVNEAGTEAAAATAVIVGETSAPEPAEIHFDRPFLFFIRDVATGTVLFFGRVEDPAG